MGKISIELLSRSWNAVYFYLFWIGEIANLSNMYAPSWECRSFVCMHLAHEILMKSMTSTSLLLLDSLGNPFRAISRILSPQKSLAVKISFTVVEYITYTNSPQEKNLLLDIFEYINASRWDLVLYTSFGRETTYRSMIQTRIYINQWF